MQAKGNGADCPNISRDVVTHQAIATGDCSSESPAFV